MTSKLTPVQKRSTMMIDGVFIYKYIGGNIENAIRVPDSTIFDTTIKEFAFPNERYNSTKQIKEKFIFFLIELNGEKRYCYCIRSLDVYISHCLCIISTHNDYDKYLSLTTLLYRYYESGNTDKLNELCMTLYNKEYSEDN